MLGNNHLVGLEEENPPRVPECFTKRWALVISGLRLYERSEWPSAAEYAREALAIPGIREDKEDRYCIPAVLLLVKLVLAISPKLQEKPELQETAYPSMIKLCEREHAVEEGEQFFQKYSSISTPGEVLLRACWYKYIKHQYDLSYPLFLKAQEFPTTRPTALLQLGLRLDNAEGVDCDPVGASEFYFEASALGSLLAANGSPITPPSQESASPATCSRPTCR